jgi:hypothetical protein
MKINGKIVWITIISLFLIYIFITSNNNVNDSNPLKNFLNKDLGCKNGEVVNHKFLASNYGRWTAFADDIYVYTKDGHLYINYGEIKSKNIGVGVPLKDKQFLVDEDVWDYINNESLYKVECKVIDKLVVVSLTEQ